MAKILDFIKLLRPQQWYKNLLVFLPIIFVGGLMNTSWFLLTFFGFLALCAVSSANYIINDIADVKSDSHNPEKKNRPIASGRVKVWQAVIAAVLLLGIAVWLGFQLGLLFLGSLAFLFVFTQIYSFWLKQEAFADVLAIGINFVVRAAAGAFIINVAISPWLVLCTFFLSLFLSVGKRHSELLFLGNSAMKHRAVLGKYSKEITNALMIIATALLVVAYSLYSFFSEHNYLIFTLPFALYVVFRYFGLVYSGSKIARHPERALLDLRMVIGTLLWAAIVFVLIYVI